VDCGLFQGLKSLRLRNWDPFPFPPASIDAVLLTHAHLDHTGFVPALIRDGFNGPIFATEGTKNLSDILLPDSGHLQEEDAEYANRKGFSKHAPALPLYTEEDGNEAMKRFTVVDFNRTQKIAPGIQATFRPAGHILGSATITLDISSTKPRTLTFSGDLGRHRHPILCSPAPLTETDFVVVESTYGDRHHEDERSMQTFEESIVRTAGRGGVIVIPSFAVDRTEVILFHLKQLSQAKRIPDLPVYVDSPMALASLAIYRKALAEGSPELEPGLRNDVDPFDTGRLIEARSVAQSRAINDNHYPSIIISASGMATGGRVLHHLANRLPDHRNTVILVGYQAAGTRGRSLIDGARSLKMMGKYIPVRAEIVNVPAFSVHADQDETIEWLRTTPRPPETTFVVHGEKSGADALHDKIERKLGWTAAVPRYLEIVRLD
jgi:metallo-beta-lactamase family protein